jgi:uncharacterized protein YebE (UPF0316 family)
MSIFLAALLIFGLRVTDVSIGTLRMLFVMRGMKWVAAGLGLVESAIFITAMSQVMRDMSPPKMIGYAAGYAVGILVGITIEQWIAAGQVMIRVISKSHAELLRDTLRAEGFGVTAVRGEGREDQVLILFVVCKRRRTEPLLRIIRTIDKEAFVTIDSISLAIGGYMRQGAMTSALALKK